MKSLPPRIALLLATGLGLGYMPVASGTFGTLLGIPIVMAMCGLPLPLQTLIAVVLGAVAIPICSAGEAHFKKKDDGHIVADEYLTFPLCVLGIPWLDHPWLLVLAFVVHRILDIIKPAPARQSQGLTGGLGIVMDDLISSLYALGVNHLVVWLAGLRG
jgi:phosphatidylglycerophosphatase A